MHAPPRSLAPPLRFFAPPLKSHAPPENLTNFMCFLGSSFRKKVFFCKIEHSPLCQVRF
jgi:hypothetical protein